MEAISPMSEFANSVDDVLITSELVMRPSRPPDYEAQSHAMLDLAEELRTNPGGVLHKVAELAMKLCHAGSAGISILEPSDERDLFRWHAIAGSLSPNIFGTLPRSASPCGTAIARNRVLLFNEPDRFYPDLRGVSPHIYESLLAPILSGRQAFVLGSRHGEAGWAIRKFAGEPLRALALNLAHWTFTLMVNVALGTRLKDPFTMYKVFRRDCIKDLSFECNRFDFDWELLVKLVRKGYRPIEVPISYRSRSFQAGKKIRIWRDPPTWIRALVKYRFQKL